jgi:ABC-type Fe3+-hydroxamate transport system substrate-binding protein
MGTVAVGGVRLLAAPIALALLLAGTACGERKEPTGPLVQVFPVTVQGAGERPAIVHAVPHRIVPLGAGPRQILRALGLQARTVTVNDQLVGLPLVGQIRRAHPDLIVASGDTDPLDLARARSSTHAAVYVEPDAGVDDVARAIGDIGLLTGKPVAARRVTGALERTRRSVEHKLGGAPVVSVFVDQGGFTTVAARSLLGDLVREAHGTSVAGASPEQGPFPLRRLAKLNPQVYLSVSGSGTSLAQLRRNPLTKHLRAVRDHRFGVVPARLVAPGPDIGAGLEQIAEILHPAAFR